MHYCCQCGTDIDIAGFIVSKKIIYVLAKCDSIILLLTICYRYPSSDKLIERVNRIEENNINA